MTLHPPSATAVEDRDRDEEDLGTVTDALERDRRRWLESQEQLTAAIRDLVERLRELETENLELRGELRRARLRESSLREERSMMVRDLTQSLDTIEKVLDLLAVRA